MPRGQDKKCGAEKPSHRPCIQSMDIPASKQPSRSTVCSSQPCSRTPTPNSENLSEVASYREIYCTSQTCSNSENCLKTLPEFCPFGLKENKNAGNQCTGSCHSGIAKTQPKVVSISRTTLAKEKQNESTPSSGHCPGGIPLSTVKQSNSLMDVSSCCAVKAISPNQSVGSPVKSPSKSPPSSPTRTKEKTSKTSPSRTPPDKIISCCEDADAMMQTRSMAAVIDAGTHPIPNTTAAGTGMPGDKAGAPTPICSPDSASKCCTPPGKNTSVIDVRRRTSFKLPEVPAPEIETPVKGHPMPADRAKVKNQDIASCACPEDKGQTKCSCHFPPAFNQFGCTGNISGNCNCNDE